MSKFNQFHVKLTDKQESDLQCFQKDHLTVQLTKAQVQEFTDNSPSDEKCILPLTPNQLNQLKMAVEYEQLLRLDFHKAQIKVIAKLNYDVDIELPIISPDKVRGLLKRSKK